VWGICLWGAPDIDPATYDGHYHPELGPTEPELDVVEIALTRKAYRRSMPILAICRGAQMLAVALGGGLLQHLPHDVGSGVVHRSSRTNGANGARHTVSVEPGSLLAGAMGLDGKTEVNSFHHQAVHELGGSLRAVAWAPDGVIEAVEAPAREFVVGVQWHAEGIIDRPEQAALLDAFVGAARRFDADAERPPRAA
jgi:putative glutamine amidotransferase